MSATTNYLQIQRPGRMTVVHFTGPVDSMDLSRLEDETQSIVQETKCKELAFDLSNIDFLNSVVVSFFVDLLQLVEKVHVFNPSDFNEALIKSTHLDSVLKIHHGWQSNLYSSAEPPKVEADASAAPGQAGSKEPAATTQVVRPQDAPVSKSEPMQAVGSANNQEVRDHLINQIRAFESALADEFDIVVDVGHGRLFVLEKVTFRGEHVLVLTGKNPDGQSVEAVQVLPSTSFLLTGVKNTSRGGERKKVDVLAKSFPSAASVVHQ